MFALAHKLMNLQLREGSSTLPSAIFGTAGSLSQALSSRPRIRIGLWPCKSETAPATAMGLMSALAILLERSQSIRVYRIFAWLEGEPKDYSWSMEKSQFSADDWRLEGLDENIAIWGNLNQNEAGWTLRLEIENDLAEDEDNVILTYEDETLPLLVNSLQNIANDLLDELNVFSRLEGFENLEVTINSQENLEKLLSSLFDWQLKLLLSIWEIDWADEDVAAAYEKLVVDGQAVGGNLGGWSVAGSVAAAMQPGFGLAVDILMPTAPDLINQFPENPAVASIVANALFRMGEVEQAYDLLENNLETYPDNAISWLELSELYLRGGRLDNSLDTFQRAIENEAVSLMLFTRYANLLIALDAQEVSVTDFILIDPDSLQSDLVIWEAIEAFEEALKLDVTRKDLLQQQILRLVDVGNEDRLWQSFERLVQLDEEGDVVRNVVDAFYDVENVNPAVDIIKKQISLMPERFDLFMNLGLVYLVAEEGKNAAAAFEQARTLTSTPDILAEIDRLMLSAEDPEFEANLTEFSLIINAGNTLSVEDVEYLEGVLEDVPSFAEGYALVARAYLAWNEDSTALEVLLDGYKNVPHSSEIINQLARLLWDLGEKTLAFDYLSKGVEAHPNDVALLALTGRYLFEDGQEDAAKSYLARAEAIMPDHPALVEVRVAITHLINERSS